MRDAHKLYLDGTHYKKRLSEREIPPEILEALLDFDSSTWTLQTAEVRTDRGKFVNSTWERVIEGHHYPKMRVRLSWNTRTIAHTVCERLQSALLFILPTMSVWKQAGSTTH